MSKYTLKRYDLYLSSLMFSGKLYYIGDDDMEYYKNYSFGGIGFIIFFQIVNPDFYGKISSNVDGS